MQEPLLKRAREQELPLPKSGTGGARAWRARLDQTAALIAPVALILGLALAGGGFDVTDRHMAGLATWLVVVGLIVLGAASRATPGPPLYWAVGLIGGLALLSAMSSFWSGSVELSLIEANRVLVYLAVLLAAFLIAQTDERRQRFAEGIAIAVTLVALLGLCSRLLPNLLDVSNALGTGPRLRYPLGYWNANGAIAGISITALLWLSRGANRRWLQWASVGVMPAVLLALYFTYSRGGLLALAVGVATLLVLSRNRLWLLGTLSVAAVGTIPAIVAAQSRRELADNIAGQAAVDQGLTVLFVLLAGTALALAGFALLRRLEERGGQTVKRALRASRSPALLKATMAIGVAAGVAFAIFAGGRAWDRFSSPDLYFPERPEQHFSQLNGAGRYDFWRVAIDATGEEPLLGQGAGAYEFSWEKHRSIEMAVHDAHSLYLEAFAELGVIGGVLVLATVAGLLWTGFGAWRTSAGAGRERNAVLFAAMLAFAVGAALDWFWELAGLGVVFFLAAGVAVATRCAQRADGQLVPDPARRTAGRRYGLALLGLGIAWVSALALVGPMLVDREIGASQSAAAAGDIAGAVSHAETARSIEPWAASPYVQLGLIAEYRGEYETAIAEMTKAIEREDRNWQLYFLRARMREEAGDGELAEADLERARVLNPLEPRLREATE
jgi:O-antigen ligase